jgi:hypothetical protein
LCTNLSSCSLSTFGHISGFFSSSSQVQVMLPLTTLRCRFSYCWMCAFRKLSWRHFLGQKHECTCCLVYIDNFPWIWTVAFSFLLTV